MSEDPVTRIAVTLIRDGYVRRADAPELLDQGIQQAVEERLRLVGLTLVLSTHTDAWGVVISPNVVKHTGTDWISNDKGLRRNTIALIVILWKELVLPRRLRTDAEAVRTGQATLTGGLIEPDEAPRTSLRQLHGDYGNRFGKENTLKGLLTYLRRVHVIEFETHDSIRAGPMLDILLPGPEMKYYVETEIAASVKRELEVSAPERT